MAIGDIKKRKIARELQEWVFLGIDDGMARSAQDYKRLTTEGRTAEALNILKRAADMPFRAQARIEAFEAKYGSTYLDECLAKYGDCTLAELKQAVVDKQIYADEKATDIIDVSKDNTVIANDIIDKIKANAQDWIFPIPSDYEEICDKKVKDVKTEKVK